MWGRPKEPRNEKEVEIHRACWQEAVGQVGARKCPATDWAAGKDRALTSSLVLVVEEVEAVGGRRERPSRPRGRRANGVVAASSRMCLPSRHLAQKQRGHVGFTKPQLGRFFYFLNLYFFILEKCTID